MAVIGCSVCKAVFLFESVAPAVPYLCPSCATKRERARIIQVIKNTPHPAVKISFTGRLSNDPVEEFVDSILKDI